MKGRQPLHNKIVPQNWGIKGVDEGYFSDLLTDKAAYLFKMIAFRHAQEFEEGHLGPGHFNSLAPHSLDGQLFIILGSGRNTVSDHLHLIA